MTWKKAVSYLVREFCDSCGSRTFTLAEFQAFAAFDLAALFPNNNTQNAKVRQTLQYLRNDGILSFADNRGTYTLRGVPLLKNEITAPAQTVLALPDDGEREYVREINARDRGWVSTARRAFGDLCLVPACANTFVTASGKRYVEVHHIDFLCEGGEDAIWNLSVVCAHHHRMAHFAGADVRRELRQILIEQTQARFLRPR